MKSVAKMILRRRLWNEVATQRGVRIEPAGLDCCNDLDQLAQGTREGCPSVGVHGTVVRNSVVSEKAPGLSGDAKLSAPRKERGLEAVGAHVHEVSLRVAVLQEDGAEGLGEL